MNAQLILGLATGVLFGGVLMLSGLSTPKLIIGMLRLENLRLMKVLIAALATGIAGIAVLDLLGVAHLSVKTLHLAAILAGGAIFGIGFAVSGYCPGTSLAAAAEGRRDAFFVVLGGLLGTGTFALLYDALAPSLIQPLTFGKPTLDTLFGVPRWAVALPLAAAMAVPLVRWWRRERTRKTPRERPTSDVTTVKAGG